MTLDEKIILNGFRLTAPRKKILSILSKQQHPISFEEYTVLDPDIDKSTFYRTMQTFEQANIISGIESEEGKRYFEFKETIHPHFICQNCHTITCLTPVPAVTLEGYHVETIIYKGRCPLCLAS
jgi:Fur family transcriptional regulator, ferric uptake regulator